MLALITTLSGMALVESLSVLNLGLTSAIVYDSRLHRRSPLPGGLSFLAGLFTSTVAVGIAVVLGVSWFTEQSALTLSPTTRYRGELIIGVILLGLACYPTARRGSTPRRAFTAARQSPLLLAGVGSAVGFGQAATDVLYLTALALLSAHNPRLALWPAIVVAYCVVGLWPPLLVLFLATRRTGRAQRVQRALVRAITRYAPLAVRAMCLAAGIALVVDAVRHGSILW